MKTPFFISLFLIAFEGFSQKITSITLLESTRGFRREIIVTEKEYILDENSIIFKKKLIPTEWNEMMKVCEKLKFEELKDFKSLSNKRAKDAALQTSITIHVGRRKFKSSTFDHDNPPRELMALLNELRKL
ncbi:hypothetical protein Emtol_2261 [Emticicia oligotrophica DSM 17448]|uniref:DUF4174 domain-containing protein n=1 Tax=Emticicia oligotrophica (strain DSM 17448 / CIP 109782 / MTCC 6937 / GPTSA100-15) TaxID=929562 RepID=A0ABN4AQJ3_EMTOG|nr:MULTISPECIES: hypothetical protein [Emticicia]AFK03399.1 hypothetical protein Emtol_2261 [Emticicia oligotrophica DSM 17448]